MNTKLHIYTEQEAFMKLSALCASAEYCEADMRRKMARWILVSPSQTLPEGEDLADTEINDEVSNDKIKNRIIDKLYQERFIDENRYAHAFVRDKFRYNHWGKVRISQELRMRKIDAAIIAEALEEIPEDDNLDTLRQLIASKKKSVKGKSEYDIRCKLIRFALGRGFQMDDILKVVGDVD